MAVVESVAPPIAAGSDDDPGVVLQRARETMHRAAYDIIAPKASPLIMSWGTGSRVSAVRPASLYPSSQAPAALTPFQYVVCIGTKAPLGFRLIRDCSSWSVVEVLPQSQAQLSGVDVGDEVLGINGLDVPASLVECVCERRLSHAAGSSAPQDSARSL